MAAQARTPEQKIKHRENERLRRERCREKIREQQRAWTAAHPERRLEITRQWNESNPERRQEISKKWHTANPERRKLMHRAHWAIRKAIRTGKLARAQSCQQCGVADVRIEAAHVDYSDLLAVNWLCVPCHRRWDRAEPKTTEHVRRG